MAGKTVSLNAIQKFTMSKPPRGMAIKTIIITETEQVLDFEACEKIASGHSHHTRCRVYACRSD